LHNASICCISIDFSTIVILSFTFELYSFNLSLALEDVEYCSKVIFVVINNSLSSLKSFNPISLQKRDIELIATEHSLAIS